MDYTQKKTSFKTNGLGKYPLYFEIWLTYTLLSDLVKYLIHRGVVNIYFSMEFSRHTLYY